MATPKKTVELESKIGHIEPIAEAEAAAVARTAREAIEVHKMRLDGPEFALVPEGTEKIDIDPWFQKPYFESTPPREFGEYQLGTVDSLVEYVNEHLKSGQTTIWVPVTRGPIVAVINDHNNDSPGWGDHRAIVDLGTTPEWDHWMRFHNQLVDQDEFANHIEEGLAEVVTPDGAELLEVAQSIEASLGGRFKSSHRLHDGRVQMEYSEEVDASAGEDGRLTIPREIELAVAPFAGEGTYKVKARFRYKIAGGKLQLGYKLDRPELVKRDAFESIADRLRQEFGRVYHGTPAKSQGII